MQYWHTQKTESTARQNSLVAQTFEIFGLREIQICNIFEDEHLFYFLYPPGQTLALGYLSIEFVGELYDSIVIGLCGEYANKMASMPFKMLLLID